MFHKNLILSNFIMNSKVNARLQKAASTDQIWGVLKHPVAISDFP